MPREVFYCDAISHHEHSTPWEAENCSMLYKLLMEALMELSEPLPGGLDGETFEAMNERLAEIESRY